MLYGVPKSPKFNAKEIEFAGDRTQFSLKKGFVDLAMGGALNVQVASSPSVKEKESSNSGSGLECGIYKAPEDLSDILRSKKPPRAPDNEGKFNCGIFSRQQVNQELARNALAKLTSKQNIQNAVQEESQNYGLSLYADSTIIPALAKNESPNSKKREEVSCSDEPKPETSLISRVIDWFSNLFGH